MESCGAFNTEVSGSGEYLIISQISPSVYIKKQKGLSDFEKNHALSEKPNKNSLTVDSSYLPVLAATSLMFAKEVGIDIPEAKDWQNLMKKYGWDGEISHPNISEGYDTFLPEFMRNTLAYLPDGVNVNDFKNSFFGIMLADNNVLYLPVIDENDDLVFYTNQGDRNPISFILSSENSINCSPLIRIPKDEIPHLFKAAVEGIMNNQTKTYPSCLAFMFWEHEQILKRTKKDDSPELRLKIEDKILKDGFELYG